MTLSKPDFFAHIPEPHLTEPTLRRPYLRGGFVVIPVIFYVLCKLSNQQVALYELLVRWADHSGRVTAPRASIAHHLGCRPTSLARHLDILATEGLLTLTPLGHIELRELRPTSLLELRRRADLELLGGQEQPDGRCAVSLICDAITDDRRLRASDRRVYGAYAARVSWNDGTTFISDARMAVDLNVNVDTIKRSKKHLAELGYIKVHTSPSGGQTITLLPPEQAPLDEPRPLQIAPPTTPDCPPDHSKLPPLTRENNQREQPDTINARAHGARSLSEQEVCEGLDDEQDPLLEQDTEELLALTHKVLGHLDDPNPELVPTLIRRRLSQGQCLTLLTAAVLSYRDYARYHLPASTFMGSVVDKWACPKARRPAQLSGRQRHAIESERRFKANLHVGAHEPRTLPTAEEEAQHIRRLEAWMAQPLTLPHCEQPVDQQRHHATEVIKLVRRAEPHDLLDFIAATVWSREVSFEIALEEATNWLLRRPGGFEPHQTQEAFEQALRRGRRDIRLEDVTL